VIDTDGTTRVVEGPTDPEGETTEGNGGVKEVVDTRLVAHSVRVWVPGTGTVGEPVDGKVSVPGGTTGVVVVVSIVSVTTGVVVPCVVDTLTSVVEVIGTSVVGVGGVPLGTVGGTVFTLSDVITVLVVVRVKLFPGTVDSFVIGTTGVGVVVRMIDGVGEKINVFGGGTSLKVCGVVGFVTDFGVYGEPVVVTSDTTGGGPLDSHGIGIVHEGVVVNVGGVVSIDSEGTKGFVVDTDGTGFTSDPDGFSDGTTGLVVDTDGTGFTSDPDGTTIDGVGVTVVVPTLEHGTGEASNNFLHVFPSS
jgi:hypothetical protein